jgi:hypothetical protein
MYVWLEHDEKSPFRNVLDRAHTTVELNSISWNKAYCMYPYKQFVKGESLLFDKGSSGEGLDTWHKPQPRTTQQLQADLGEH